MPYTGDLPVNPRSWQKATQDHEVIDQEWWGWAIIDLLLETPLFLTKYFLRKIRYSVRRVFCSHQERSPGMKAFSITLRRRLQRK